MSESVQLNIIQEVWDLINADSHSAQDNWEPTAPGEQSFMILSVAALSGVEAPRTLKIKDQIQGVEMLILIDSGSSHSFISEQVATVLKGVTTVSSPTQVQVANGHTLQSLSEMLNAEWFIQGCQFHSDLKVLALQSYDMILGMEWLERFSPMKIHWAHKWLSIPYNNGTITLQGILPGSLECNMVELIQLSSEHQSIPLDQLPEDIQLLIQQF
jgi:hypothetical protein